MKQRFVTIQILCLCLISSTLLLTGCDTVPISGRRQLNYVPDSYINSMSFDSYREFLSKSKVSTDPKGTAMVKRVGENIQKAVERYFEMENQSELLEGYEWEFNLVDDPAANAWAMAGGKVVVYTGLLKIAKTDEQLAVVVGHEIAHAVARHGSERLSQQLIYTFGGVALDKALEDQPGKTKELIMTAYGAGGQYGVLLPYSRLHETEADHLGMIFMALAGYNPEAAVSFWENMSANNKGKEPPEFLSTHPSHSTRIEKIKEFMPKAMFYYTGKPR